LLLLPCQFVLDGVFHLVVSNVNIKQHWNKKIQQHFKIQKKPAHEFPFWIEVKEEEPPSHRTNNTRRLPSRDVLFQMVGWVDVWQRLDLVDSSNITSQLYQVTLHQRLEYILISSYSL
jgi:hypothetical protein